MRRLFRGPSSSILAGAVDAGGLDESEALNASEALSEVEEMRL